MRRLLNDNLRMEFQVFSTYVQITILRYFDRSGFLKLFEEETEKFAKTLTKNEETYSIFYIPVHIDVKELNEVSSWLCSLLIKEPDIFQRSVTEFVRTGVEEVLDVNGKLNMERIIAPIVILPIDVGLQTYPAFGLCYIRGIISHHTLVQKYIRSSVWRCRKTACITQEPSVVHALPKKEPTCPLCAAPMEEIPNAKDMGTYYMLHLSLGNSLVTNVFHQGALVRIDDDRNEGICIELGNEIIVVGVKRDTHFEAWGGSFVNPVLHSPIKYSTLELIKSRSSNSPWAFVQFLSSLIGRVSYPPGTFTHLRAGLLLSLASIRSINPIAILAICEDPRAGEAITLAALRLLPRCIKSFLPTCLGGYVKDNWLHGGLLLLAKNTVCYLGNWASYEGKNCSTICGAVSSTNVVLEGGDGLSVPLQCAVWTYFHKPNKQKDLKQLEMLLKVFGICWRVEAINDEIIIDHILNYTNITDNLEQELKKYIEAVNCLKVNLSDEAVDLLKKYFACTRKLRGGKLPLTSLDPLRALTESHARLNKRVVAGVEDALVALELCERSLGRCPIIPEPPININQFEQWLEEHVLSIKITDFEQ